MGNSRSSLQLQPEDITAIQDETGFNPNQIERLYSRWDRMICFVSCLLESAQLSFNIQFNTIQREVLLFLVSALLVSEV